MDYAFVKVIAVTYVVTKQNILNNIPGYCTHDNSL